MSDFLNWVAATQDGMAPMAGWFVGLFRKRAGTLLDWMTNITPLVLILLIAMNSPTALIGEKHINKFVVKAGRNVVNRRLILPWIGALFLTNPAAFTLGRFLPGAYKLGCYASVAQMVHTNNGPSPHSDPGELFVWAGIAQGIITLQLPIGDLATRYLLLGAVLDFFGGWVVDLTTVYVAKQQGVTLSEEVHVHV